MSARERVMEQINAMSDEDVIRMLRMWNSLLWMDQEHAQEPPSEVSPWDVLRKYRASVTRDIDYKAELARYRDEKYAHFDRHERSD